jgi:hypothetical protein
MKMFSLSNKNIKELFKILFNFILDFYISNAIIQHKIITKCLQNIAHVAGQLDFLHYKH